MRAIKAYLRLGRSTRSSARSTRNGIAHMTLSHVRSLGSGVDPRHQRLSFDTGTMHTEKAKLEVVCSEPEIERLVPDAGGGSLDENIATLRAGMQPPQNPNHPQCLARRNSGQRRCEHGECHACEQFVHGESLSER